MPETPFDQAEEWLKSWITTLQTAQKQLDDLHKEAEHLSYQTEGDEHILSIPKEIGERIERFYKNQGNKTGSWYYDAQHELVPRTWMQVIIDLVTFAETHKDVNEMSEKPTNQIGAKPWKTLECDNDCNHCVVVNDLNWVQIYLILARIVRWDQESMEIINASCPNATVCPECRIDDFVHSENCSLGQKLDAEVEEEVPPCDHDWETVPPSQGQLKLHFQGYARRCKKCHQREWVAE
jgi:hypothetical protein